MFVTLPEGFLNRAMREKADVVGEPVLLARHCPLCGDELVGFNTETLNQRFKQHARNRHKKEYAQIRREID